MSNDIEQIAESLEYRAKFPFTARHEETMLQAAEIVRAFGVLENSSYEIWRDEKTAEFCIAIPRRYGHEQVTKAGTLLQAIQEASKDE